MRRGDGETDYIDKEHCTEDSYGSGTRLDLRRCNTESNTLQCHLRRRTVHPSDVVHVILL